MSGHNSGDPQLTSLVARIVRLETEKRERAEDIREVYAEVKSNGYEPKAVRIVVRHELDDPQKRAERERIQAEADLMLARIGPLGEAAVRHSVAKAGRALDKLADEDGVAVSLHGPDGMHVEFGTKARAARSEL